MKSKLLTIVIVILVVWNIILTYQLVVAQKIIHDEQGQTLIRQSNTEIESDVTKVVSNTDTKVVGVTSKNAFSTLAGSGVIYGVSNDEVIIVTSNSILNNSGDVFISFANDVVIEAEILGKDSVTDLAVLKAIVPFSVEAFNLGNSSLVKTGEWVLLSSNQTGSQSTGTYALSIIANADRSVIKDLDNDGNGDWQLPLLQVSTPVYSLNNGGALINMASELIGVVSSKTSNGINDGSGLVIGINEVKDVVDKILATGEVKRTYLGLSVIPLESMPVYLKSHYQVKLNIEGVMISTIYPDGPADLAGLRQYDIITDIDDKSIMNNDDIRSYLANKEAEEVIKVTYLRNDTINQINVVLK
ncbi:MAG: PDZ domain-containing protein [Erysipelotrichaceae bacterium]|nr:PDZ domain-containing protein [Erysipelotrichaceae bacterium]